MPSVIFERPNPNFASRDGVAIDCLVIHDTDCREVGSTLPWFEPPSWRVSAHYVVDRDGAVYRCVADEARAWHAGDSVLDGREDVDKYSIGIELVGFTSRAYMPAQIDALAEVCAMLCRKYKIPIARIVGHQDIAVPAGRKTDPGPHFPWADVRGRVARQLGVRVA